MRKIKSAIWGRETILNLDSGAIQRRTARRGAVLAVHAHDALKEAYGAGEEAARGPASNSRLLPPSRRRDLVRQQRAPRACVLGGGGRGARGPVSPKRPSASGRSMSTRFVKRRRTASSSSAGRLVAPITTTPPSLRRTHAHVHGLKHDLFASLTLRPRLNKTRSLCESVYPEDHAMLRVLDWYPYPGTGTYMYTCAHSS